MSGDAKKRKRPTPVTLDEKLNALDRLKDGETITSIAQNLGVDVTTVRRWKSKVEVLKSWREKCNNAGRSSKNCCRMRDPEHKHLDEVLWIWFSQLRATGTPINGPMLRAQALKFNASMGGEKSFQASEGWLSKWKKRHQIRQFNVNGDTPSFDLEATENYKETLHKIMEEEKLTADQIFNGDESGLNIKMLPTVSSSMSTEYGATDSNQSRDRLTFLACSNASGALKLPLLVVGKFPDASTNFNSENMPVVWKSQSSAWISSSLFAEWFHEVFVPLVRNFLKVRGLPPKARLIINNYWCQPQNFEDGDIKIMFLPPSVTLAMQNVDRGVIECVKRRYRQKLMMSLLEDVEENGGTVLQHLEDVGLRDILYWLADAWTEIPPEVVKKCWRKIWSSEETNERREETIDEIKGFQLWFTEGITEIKVEPKEANETNDDLTHYFCEALQQVPECMGILEEDVQRWLDGSNVDEVNVLSDDEILSVFLEQDREIQNKENCEEDKKPHLVPVTYADAKVALRTVISFCETEPGISHEEIASLRRLRDHLTLKNLQESAKNK